MDLIERLNWRYATKAMNGKTVPEEKVERILETARLAPTSSGLQPYEIFVITNPEMKVKIRQIAFDQRVITECSHLLVFAAWDNYTTERINKIFDLTNEIRGGSNPFWENYRQRLLGIYPARDAKANFEHAARQSYIGFMAAITAAAFEEVDATPMEGFDNEALDNLLGLHEKGLRSITLLPLGYRDEKNDWLLPQAKARNKKEDFITYIK